MIKNQTLGGSNKVLIFLGLFLGLVSAVLVVVYLKSSDGNGGGSVSSGATTSVAVAKGDIPAGTRLTEDMLTVKPISNDAVLPSVFKNTEDLVDQVTRVPLVAGEQIVPTKVTATGAAIADVENPPLSYIVPEGKRAFAIEVSNITGASGLIRPGDFVDIILSVKIEGGGDNPIRDQISKTIVQNVQVLSVDQKVAKVVAGDAEAPAADSTEAQPDATSITLAASPAQGELLSTAQMCAANFSGRLSTALRAFGDSTDVPASAPTASCAALLGLTSLS